MDPVIKAAYDAALKGQSFAFATVVESSAHGTPRKSGAKMVVLNDGTILGSIGGGKSEKEVSALCLKAIQNNQPKILDFEFSGVQGQPICGGKVKIFIEPFQGQKQLIICGAGHIALPLSVIGKILNFSVSIIDDRREFANRERFPHVDQIYCGDHKKQLAKLHYHPNTYVVIITQDHKRDFICLRKTLSTPVPYIGIIGSIVKRQKFFSDLGKNKNNKEHLNKISMPVGLDVGAQTPEEIAISIMAEIIAKYQKAETTSLKFIQKTKLFK